MLSSFCPDCFSPLFEENSDNQVTVNWPSHGITESEAIAKCNDTIVNKTVIGDSCFDNNSGGGTSSDDIIQACVNDVQVLPVFFHSFTCCRIHAQILVVVFARVGKYQDIFENVKNIPYSIFFLDIFDIYISSICTYIAKII